MSRTRGPGLLRFGLTVAAFAMPFVMLMGVLGWKGRFVPMACAMLGAALALAGTWLERRFGRPLFRTAAASRPLSQAELLQGRQEIAASIERFASDPRWPRWADLARKYSVTSEATVAAWERRYQEILADPKRCHHVVSMLQGDTRSNEQLDYADDSSLLRTCTHLQPVERALRALPGAACAALNGPHVIASVSVDFDALKRVITLPACVNIVWFVPRPHATHEDVIECSVCGSSITAIEGLPFP